MTLSLMTLHIYNNIHIACRYTISNINRYRVFAGNLQKRNGKIDTSMGPIGAQNLFSSLYKLG